MALNWYIFSLLSTPSALILSQYTWASALCSSLISCSFLCTSTSVLPILNWRISALHFCVRVISSLSLEWDGCSRTLWLQNQKSSRSDKLQIENTYWFAKACSLCPRYLLKARMHRCFLRFAFKGELVKVKVLPSWLSKARETWDQSNSLGDLLANGACIYMGK